MKKEISREDYLKGLGYQGYPALRTIYVRRALDECLTKEQPSVTLSEICHADYKTFVIEVMAVVDFDRDLELSQCLAKQKPDVVTKFMSLLAYNLSKVWHWPENDFVELMVQMKSDDLAEALFLLLELSPLRYNAFFLVQAYVDKQHPLPITKEQCHKLINCVYKRLGPVIEELNSDRDKDAINKFSAQFVLKLVEIGNCRLSPFHAQWVLGLIEGDQRLDVVKKILVREKQQGANFDGLFSYVIAITEHAPYPLRLKLEIIAELIKYIDRPNAHVSLLRYVLNLMRFEVGKCYFTEFDVLIKIVEGLLRNVKVSEGCEYSSFVIQLMEFIENALIISKADFVDEDEICCKRWLYLRDKPNYLNDNQKKLLDFVLVYGSEGLKGTGIIHMLVFTLCLSQCLEERAYEDWSPQREINMLFEKAFGVFADVADNDGLFAGILLKELCGMSFKPDSIGRQMLDKVICLLSDKSRKGFLCYEKRLGEFCSRHNVPLPELSPKLRAYYQEERRLINLIS